MPPCLPSNRHYHAVHCWLPAGRRSAVKASGNSHQGADVETGYPLAEALCWKIRTVLGVFKRHKDRFPSFQDQVNMALRHHCKEGNFKWVSLLLWAGADPFAKGPDSPGEDPDPEEDLCALEYAALYKHFDIFKLKKIKISPDHPIASDLLENACRRTAPADAHDKAHVAKHQPRIQELLKDFGEA